MHSIKRITLFSLLIGFAAIFSCGTDDIDPCPNPPCDPGDTSDIILNCNPTVFDFSTIIPEMIDTVPPFEQPDSNIATVEGIDLGRHLFFDTLISLNHGTACATCHQVNFAFSDNIPFSTNEGGSLTPFTTSTLINMAWKDKFFWNGRVSTIEDAIADAIVGEHLIDWPTTINELTADSSYLLKFQSAFCEKTIKKDLVIKAIAQFLRSLISLESRFDNARGAFTLDEQLGLQLFFSERGDCFHCHQAVLFGDSRGHNNGLDSLPKPGIEAITMDPNDRGKFITPTLRNIEYFAPYMHDGRFNTLTEVIEQYSDHVKNSPTTDPLMEFAPQGGVMLTDDEKRQLEAFLKTLSDPNYLTNPKHQNPF